MHVFNGLFAGHSNNVPEFICITQKNFSYKDALIKDIAALVKTSLRIFPFLLFEPVMIPSYDYMHGLSLFDKNTLFRPLSDVILSLHEESEKKGLPYYISCALRFGLIVFLYLLNNQEYVFCIHPDNIQEAGVDCFLIIESIMRALKGSWDIDCVSRKSSISFDMMKKGRPRFADLHPELLEALEYYFNPSVNPRVNSETMYKNNGKTSCRLFADYFHSISGHSITRQTVLRYLRPAYVNSHAALRHHMDVSLNFRPVLSSKDGLDFFRVDDHYCSSQNKLLRSVMYLLGDESLMISKDDKAKLHFFVSATARAGTAWCPFNSEEGYTQGTSIPVHDFSSISKLSITPTCFLKLQLATPRNLDTKKLFSEKGGLASYMLNPQSSTAIHQLDVLFHQFAEQAFGSLMQCPPILNLRVDGGSDETMKHRANKFLYAFLIVALHLDLLAVSKNEPNGGSKKNECEAVHVALGSAIGQKPLLSQEDAYKHGILSVDAAGGCTELVAEALTQDAMDEVIKRTNLVSYHGQPVTVKKWPVPNDDLIYVPHKMEEALELIRKSKNNSSLITTFERLELEFPMPLQSLRKKLGLQFRKSCTAAEVLHLTEGRVFTSEHLFISGPCCSAECSYGRCRNYRSTGGMISMILGDKNRVNRLASIVLPVVDPSSDFNHYVPDSEKLHGNFPILDCCPSTLVTAFVREHVNADGTITAAQSHLQLLANTCCFGSRSRSLNQFNRFVHASLAKLCAKRSKSFANKQVQKEIHDKVKAVKAATKLAAREAMKKRQVAEQEKKRQERKLAKLLKSGQRMAEKIDKASQKKK